MVMVGDTFRDLILFFFVINLGSILAIIVALVVVIM